MILRATSATLVFTFCNCIFLAIGFSQDGNSSPNSKVLEARLVETFRHYAENSEEVEGEDLRRLMADLQYLHKRASAGKYSMDSFNALYGRLTTINVSPSIKIDALRLVGQTAYLEDRNDDAITAFTEARIIYEQLDEGEKLECARSMSTILYFAGTCELEEADHEQSAFRELLADKHVQAQSEPVTLVSALVKLANFEKERKGYDKASYLFNRAKKLCEKHRKPNFKFRIGIEIGLVECDLKREKLTVEEAVRTLEETKEKFSTQDFDDFEMLVNSLLAFYQKNKDEEKIDKLLEESFSRSCILFAEGSEKHQRRGLTMGILLVKRSLKQGKQDRAVEFATHAIEKLKPNKAWIKNFPKEFVDKMKSKEIDSLPSVIEN